MKCLKCSSKIKQGYCEECIQELISENMRLQLRIKELEHKPKHMKDDIEKHIPVID